jgi:hypothetical protein
MSKIPIIKSDNVKEFTVKQSKYDCVGKLPTRSLICSPSGGGKTVLLSNLILDVYRDCFSRIFVFSPSIHVDHTWLPVKKYIESVMKVKHTDEDPIYFSEYEPDQLENIIETQHKIIKHMKDKGQTKLFQILVVIDDFADNPDFSRNSKLLNQLYIRGRHNCISTITSTQKYRAISNIIRINITEIFIFKLRNAVDLEAILEELSALTDKKTLMSIYNAAVEKPYNFLYIKMNSKDKNEMFFINFEKRIEIED